MDDMMAAMTSRQISEWMAFDALEPFGERRADVRSAIIASTIANVNKSKKQQPFTIEQFIPVFDEDEAGPDEPETEALHAKIASIAAIFGHTGQAEAIPNGDTGDTGS